MSLTAEEELGKTCGKLCANSEVPSGGRVAVSPSRALCQPLQAAGGGASFAGVAVHGHGHGGRAAAADAPAREGLRRFLLAGRHYGQRAKTGWRGD